MFSTLPSYYFKAGSTFQRLLFAPGIALSLLLAIILVAPGTASAQMRRAPGQGYHPMQRDVTGFMQLCAGLTYAPAIGVEGKSHVDGEDFTVSDVESSGPGYSVSFYLIPTWGKNGVYFGASYDLSAVRFSHETGEGDAAVSGDSSMGVSDMVVRVGYVRYFGNEKWHPYFLGGAGLSWQTARLGTNYVDEDDKVEDSKINTPLIGLGVGIGKEAGGGMYGAEFRADFYPLILEHEFPGPHDRFDLDLSRPVILKLMAVFSIGHL